MPPRRTKRGATQRSQRSGRSQRVADESEEESDNDAPPTRSSQPERTARSELDIPPSVLSWAQKGLYDLPAIPDYGGDAGDDDDDDEDGSDSAPLLAKMILLRHHKKEPFTNNQLSNHWSKMGQKSDDFERVFKKARRLLLEDFGYVVAEIRSGIPVFPMTGHGENVVATQDDADIEIDDEEGTTQRKRGGKKAITFILMNTGSPQASHVNCGRSSLASRRNAGAGEAATLSLLTLTLLYIYMDGDGETSEEYLGIFLKHFGFEMDNTHCLVGKVRDVLNGAFFKQQYLTKQKVRTGKDPSDQLFYYCWGPRADLEFSKLAMLNLCGKVLGVPADAEHFGEKYHNATSVEKRRLAKLQSFSESQ